MKAVLFPTDFSTNSMHAIQYTVELLKNEPCTFYVLHVHQASSYISDDLMHVPTSDSIHKILVDNTKETLDGLVDQLKLVNNPKHQFEVIVDYDNFIDAINQVCKIHQIDFIAMGMQGKSATEQILFGSHTVRVIQRSTTPVLVVPEDYKLTVFDKVIVAVNNYKSLNNSGLNVLKLLDKMYNIEIKVLNVIKTEQADEVAQNFRIKLNEIPYHLQTIKTKDSFKSIEKYVEEHDIKLVVMGREKHNFFERLFTKHAVETFAYNMKVPLLVLGQNSEVKD